MGTVTAPTAAAPPSAPAAMKCRGCDAVFEGMGPLEQHQRAKGHYGYAVVPATGSARPGGGPKEAKPSGKLAGKPSGEGGKGAAGRGAKGAGSRGKKKADESDDELEANEVRA